MNIDKNKFLGLSLSVIGLLFLLNAKIEITGAIIGSTNTTSMLSSILGLIFVVVGIAVMTKGEEGGLEKEIKLEEIKKNIKNIEEIKKNRDIFIEDNYKAYKRYLEKEGKIPEELSEKEKYNYAKKELENSFSPLVNYTNENAIEFCEYFGSTPERDKIPLQGESYKVMKAKIHYEVANPALKEITENAEKNSRLWQSANKRIYRLTETADLGSIDNSFKYVDDTSNKYLYLRDTGSGARIFLKRVNDKEYKLIGICSGNQKKDEEDKMINLIKSMYNSDIIKENKKYPSKKKK